MRHKPRGFTIVELLIVIVIIGILATIVVVAYNGITRKAQDATLQSDLKNASTALEIANATDGSYPSSDSSLKFSPDTNHSYTPSSDGSTYCLEVSSPKTTNVYSVTNGSTMTNGTCPLIMQTITTANCPSTMTRAYDARDNHSYWVQKLADGKCWMLTNLAYAGGGINTYSDIRTISNSTGPSFDQALYYVPPSTINYTTEPAAPSISANGTGQYGYLYNWCAAMGGQAGNGACSNVDATQPNVNITICPKNWRLPTGQATTGEFTSLNNAINSGSTSSPAGLLLTWLAQYGGTWLFDTYDQGSRGYYWSSTIAWADHAYGLSFYDTNVNTNYVNNDNGKDYGFAVRCLAAV